MKMFSKYFILLLTLAACNNNDAPLQDAIVLEGTPYTVGGENGGDTVTVRLEDDGDNCILRHITHVNGVALNLEITAAQFATATNGVGGWNYQDRENTPITIPNESCQDWLDYVATLNGGNADLECGIYVISGPTNPITFNALVNHLNVGCVF